MDKKLLTIEEAADYLRIHKRSLHRFLDQRGISCIRLKGGERKRGNKLLFRESDLSEFLNRRREPSIYSLVREIHDVVTGRGKA